MQIVKSNLVRAGFPALALAAWFTPAQAAVVTLNPSHDTSLIQVQPDRNNGGEAWFLAGTTQNGTLNRGLIQFDFTGVLPPNAVITSVNLSLDVTRVPSCGSAISSFSLHRLLVPWGEGNKVALDNNGGQGAPATAGEATWSHRFLGGPAWSAPGGAPNADYAVDPSASAFIYGTGDSPYDFAGTAMVSDVQGWLAGSQSNFGWIFISDDEGTPFTARRFGSREDPNATPQLTVRFDLVPEPPTAALFGLALALAAAAAGRKRVPIRLRGRA